MYRSPNSTKENWALALSWEKSLNLITGIVLGLLPKELEALCVAIRGLNSDTFHPMQVPVILCEMQTDADSNDIKRHALSLFQVELQTRMHIYDLPEPLTTSKDLEYDDVTRRLNGIISRLSFHQMRIENTIESLKYIKTCEKQFYGEGNANAESLHSRIQQLSDENRALLAEVQCNQRIAQSQLDVVS